MTGSFSAVELIKKNIPQLNEDLLSYVESILDDNSSHFESSSDIVDAIGELLTGVDSSKTDEDIDRLCEEIFLNLNCDDNDYTNRRLDAPIQMAQLSNQNARVAEATNCWLTHKPQENSLIEIKKIEKSDKKSTAVKTDNEDAGGASVSQQINRRDAAFEGESITKVGDIKIESFDIAFGNKKLLEECSVTLCYGRRYGFVGRNGLGKTTLLKAIANRELRLPSHVKILHVEQEVDGDDTLAVNSVLEADEQRHSLLTRLGQLTDRHDEAASQAISEIYAELSAIEADSAPARAAVILHGLGFTPEMQQRKTREFSGGWRMRIALARALFSQPDLLLLDEPTNMLDMKAIIWLEDYLCGWPTTLVVVSHDREFLNSVATDILHLNNNRKIDSYRGNFETFAQAREELLKNRIREYEAQVEERAHIQKFIDKFRYNANRAALVQSRVKYLEKLPKLEPVEKEAPVILRFHTTEKLSGTVVQLDDLEFHFDKLKPIFKRVNVNASSDSRICVVGENGAGKTTLLKLLLGDLEPVSGHRHVHRALRIGYFSQHHVDQLDLNMNSVEFLASKFPGRTSESYRGDLGGFGISGDLALKPIKSLSGGQKSRVAFAAMCVPKPNFLILDEPTNHLDMETIAALGNSINSFNGGVVLVSHDERLISMICKEMWLCADHDVNLVEGGMSQYRKMVRKELASL